MKILLKKAIMKLRSNCGGGCGSDSDSWRK